MTRNQIDYLKHLETQRSNRAQESLTQSAQAETHRFNVESQAEVRRHNMASEGLSSRTLAETRRHNMASEGLGQGELLVKQFNAEETKRSNLAKESETHRANLAKEQETNRANLANEAIGWGNIGVAQQNVNARFAELAEANRANVARETETNRHNQMTEYDAALNTYIDWRKASTDKKFKEAQIGIGWANVGANYLNTASQFVK